MLLPFRKSLAAGFGLSLLAAGACESTAKYTPPPADSYTAAPLAVETGGERGVNGALVAPTFFQVSGVHALLGRLLLPNDSVGVVVSEKLWRERYAADPTIIGRPLHIGGRLRSIVGVVPKSFDFPPGADAWISRPQPAKQ